MIEDCLFLLDILLISTYLAISIDLLAFFLDPNMTKIKYWYIRHYFSIIFSASGYLTMPVDLHLGPQNGSKSLHLVYIDGSRSIYLFLILWIHFTGWIDTCCSSSIDLSEFGYLTRPLGLRFRPKKRLKIIIFGQNRRLPVHNM